MSIGISLLDQVTASADAVLAAADLAMYAAKDAGRDRFAVYDPTGPHRQRASNRYRWLDRVRTALDEDLFVLHAQPIVEVESGRTMQLEVLLRMREGDRLVPPEDFLGIAERHGMGPAIDRWVIGRAIAFAGTFDHPDAPRIEVNLSADSLADSGLPEVIAALLVEHGVPASRMVFEVTETAAIANLDTAQVFVAELTQLGCRFALDDFGAGFASFANLKHLPCDYLKIDGEFIRRLTTSHVDQVIVTSIVAAAQGLGKKTIAEYVGDAETLALLRQLGVDYAQGHHVGLPVDLDLLRLPRPRPESSTRVPLPDALS